MAYPAHWQRELLGALFHVVTGKTPPTRDNDAYLGGGIPFAKPGDLDSPLPLRTADTLTPAGLAVIPSLPAGSVLVSCIGNLGKVSLTSEVGSCNQQINAITPTRGIDSRFVYHWAKTLRPWLEENASATTVSIVNKGRLERASFPLPPLNEQRRIVDKIEALTARSRRAKEALDAVPILLDKLRQSILAAAFRGDLTKEWRAAHPDVEPASVLLDRIRKERRARWEEAELAKMRAKGSLPKDDKWKSKYVEPEPVNTDDLPELPEGWAWTSVGELCLVDSGEAFKKAEYAPTGLRLVQIANVGFGEVLWDSLQFVPQHYDQAYAHIILNVDDMVLALNRPIIGGRLKCATLTTSDAPAMLYQRVGRLKPATKPVAQHLNRFMQSATAVSAVQSRLQGSDQPYLNTSLVPSIPVPLCPATEMVELDRVCAEAIGRFSELGILRELAEELIALDSAILAKAFRGELVPQDPNDEPASALLERIRAERESGVTTSPTKKTRAKRTAKTSKSASR